MIKNKYLFEFLKVYWLRPETSLWRSVDAIFLKKYIPINPALDIGSGDGTFQFVIQDGVFDLNFDIFQSANTKDFWKNKDIYDFVVKDFKTNIKKKPKFIFDVGFDHKENLLKKSALLGIYKKLVAGDANKKLPFKNNSFKFIFSNIFYWIENLDGLLEEVYRVLKPNGLLIITVPTKNLELYRPTYKPELFTKNKVLIKILKKLNRGRSESYHHVYEADEWINILKKKGFLIVDHKEYLSRKLIFLWDIGLRPFSPYTIKMERILERLGIKRFFKFIYVHLFYILLKPIAVIEAEDDKKYPPAFLGIVAKKR